jgi:hypothetical protein
MTGSWQNVFACEPPQQGWQDHTYWSLVETVRTPDGPCQKTLCCLGELNSSAQARWLTTVEVFNEQGEARQLKLFPSHVAPPADAPGQRNGPQDRKVTATPAGSRRAAMDRRSAGHARQNHPPITRRQLPAGADCTTCPSNTRRSPLRKPPRRDALSLHRAWYSRLNIDNLFFISWRKQLWLTIPVPAG